MQPAGRLQPARPTDAALVPGEPPSVARSKDRVDEIPVPPLCSSAPPSNRRRREHEKKFYRDDPRAAESGGFSFWLGLPALPVAVALSLSLLLAVCRLAVASPRLPLPPAACLLAARLAAVACQRLLGSEDPFAALQQTSPTPGTASPPPARLGLESAGSSWSSSGVLIFGRS